MPKKRAGRPPGASAPRRETKTVDRKIRLSQTVSPFGVGAVYDLLGESFVACDTNLWGPNGHKLRLPRLEEELHVEHFRSAPSQAEMWGKYGAGVPYVRFPKWLFCQRCRTMYLWRSKHEVEGEPARCSGSQCGRALLIPMRFVAICKNSHLADVPWIAWAHSQATEPSQKQCSSLNLALLKSKKASAGLDSLVVMCRTCKAKRSLAGISQKDSLVPLSGRFPHDVLCGGTQPWQGLGRGESCGEPLQVVQRGASNVYFATVRTAIDIPPDSNYDPFSAKTQEITTDSMFDVIVTAPDGPASIHLYPVLAQKYEVSEDHIRGLVAHAVAAREGRSIEAGPPEDAEDLLGGEWLAFTAPDREPHPLDRFVKVSGTLLGDARDTSPLPLRLLDDLVDRVVAITRLREVRALAGFSRYEMGAREVSPSLGRDLQWLPATEVYGEGIFLSLNEDSVAAWEFDENARTVAETLEKRRQKSLVASRLRPVTPRYLLLHSLAHVVIRQLAFECGYAIASLRERIYSNPPEGDGPPQAGILIYTAAGDSEGTLGGLVAQAEPPRLAMTVLRALERASWCSTDPLCRENTGQGFGALNRAACHACSLLPETSCEAGNKLLDRGMLIGGEPVQGFFERVFEAGMADAARVGQEASS